MALISAIGRVPPALPQQDLFRLGAPFQHSACQEIFKANAQNLRLEISYEFYTRRIYG